MKIYLATDNTTYYGEAKRQINARSRKHNMFYREKKVHDNKDFIIEDHLSCSITERPGDASAVILEITDVPNFVSLINVT